MSTSSSSRRHSFIASSKDDKAVLPLTPREIEFISRHEGRIYKFDLSQINEKSFDGLISFFQNDFEFGMDGLGFNNDFLIETIRKKEREQIENPFDDPELSYPYILEQSVTKNRKNFVTQLISGLSNLLNRSASLAYLKFRFLPFQQSDFDILSNALINCSSLRIFKLCDIQLGDNQFGKLSRALRKMNIEEVQFRKCCLSDAISYDMRTFLSFHSFSKSELMWKNKMLGKNKKDKQISGIHNSYLQFIDMRENNFSESFVEIIYDSLKDLNPLLFDLRGNDQIKQTSYIKAVQKSIPNCTIKVSYCKPPKTKLNPQQFPQKDDFVASSIMNFPKLQDISGNDFSKSLPLPSISDRSQSSSFSSISHDRKKNSKILELEEENRRLKQLIEQLELGANIIELEPDLFIVGEQSQEFVERICKLDSLLTRAANGPMPFLIRSRQQNLTKHKSGNTKSPSKRKPTQKLKRKV